MQDYQQQCLVTEAPITEAIKQRYEEVFGAIHAHFQEMSKHGEKLDALKKYVFYGRTSEYAELAKNKPIVNLSSEFTNKDMRQMHAVLGVLTEVPEIVDAFYKQDDVNMMEEWAGLFWYGSLGLDASGYTLAQAQERNIGQLRARYGDKFSEYDANNRDLSVERKILEGENGG